MALLAVITARLSSVGSLTLVIIYKLWKLEKVKKEHKLEKNASFIRMSP